MLKLVKENHLIYFDSESQYFCSYTFSIVLPESKKKQKDKDKQKQKDKEGKKNQQQQREEKPNIQLQQQYPINFYINSEERLIYDNQTQKYYRKNNGFEYKWQSDYFDLQIKRNEIEQFGALPFSLQTFLEIYKDPKNWDISLRPKNDEIQLQTVLNKNVGKLIIETNFKGNPFLLPVRLKNNFLQCKKTIKVITVVQNDQKGKIPLDLKQSNKSQENGEGQNDQITEEIQIGEQVISSADFISRQKVLEVDIFKPQPLQETKNGFYVYTFEASERVSTQHICIIKDKFDHKQFSYKNKVVHIYSGNNKPVQFIHNLQKAIKMLKFVDNDIYIFQNINTDIQDCHRIVFFTDLTSLYSKIFRSFLYNKIYDQWIIQGIVHYSRDNRHFQDCMTQLTDLLSEGEQFFPLSNSQYSFDHVWKVKAKFIYHILENLSNNNLTKQILQYAKKKKLTSPMILKKMKDRFGVDKIKTIYEQQFIHSTGMNRIFYQMEHLKRQHKLKITLRQKSLVCNIFRRYNRHRIRLEELYNLVSPIMERIIQKNQSKKNQMSGPLAVPRFLKCIPYFVGSVSVEIQNSQPFFQPLQQQNITERITDQKASLRIKRNTGKKNEPENNDSISWMMLDSSLIYPAVYKGKNLSESVIESLVKRVYESQIQQLKVLNSISIKEHSESSSICKLLIQKVKIKPGKEDCKISVKRKILQLLPNFLEKSCDPLIYDQILELLQLYEPICYDYSEEGNLFLHSLIQSIGNITYSIKMHQYFEQFHRLFLSISKYHHSIFNEDKFEQIHKQLFKSMMKWLSKYSFKILEQARDYLDITFSHPRKYLQLIKIIIQGVLVYMDMMKIKQEEKSTSIFKQIYDRIYKHMKIDQTGLIRAVFFGYEASKRQKNKQVLEFLQETFEQLQYIRDNQPKSYPLCLSKFKDVLNSNRQKYAYDVQAECLNENQNYFLAEYLWKQMCSPQSLHNAKVRLAWMKIYRIFYFYFTPIITMVKLNKNIISKQFPLNQSETIQVLDNIMDFVPDIKWFSVYDSSNHKKKKTEQIHGRRKKRQNQEFNFSDKNMFTVYVAENPSKTTWEDLSRLGLDYLKKEYENKQIETGNEKFKKIVEKIKETSQKLKRGNMPSNFTYDKMKKKIYSALQEGDQSLQIGEQLFAVLEKTLREVQELRKKKQSEQKGDTSVFLPYMFNLPNEQKKGQTLD